MAEQNRRHQAYMSMSNAMMNTYVIDFNAHDGDAHALLVEFFNDPRNGCCRFFVVDRDPHQF